MYSASNTVPTVTVIVPNYNHARFLPKRLESIFAQTYRDFELIVLDDASTDDSIKVLQPYAERGQIRLVTNAQNSGCPFIQWARGAELARGEMLWIAESDDFADPQLLEKLVAAFSRCPDIGLAYCQSWQVDSAGNVGASCEKWNHTLDPVRWTADYTNGGRDEVARYLSMYNTIPNASAVLSRTTLLRRAVVGAAAYRLSGDWRTWINILTESDIVFVADCLNYFRIHDRSVRDTTRDSRACAESLTMKLYACNRSQASASLREKSFDLGFPQWARCLNAEGIKAWRPWVAQTIRDGFRLSAPGGCRMLGTLLFTLMKRIFLRHRLQAALAPR